MIAEQAREALRRHVLEPLLAHSPDEEHGGFLVDFDDRWRSAGPHDKSLEHAARTTTCLALLDRAMPGEGCDRLARRGCAFLQDVMWDRQHGGFFARVDRSGQPLWDGLKHPHAVTYTAQAFLACSHLLAPGEGDRWARKALDWLDEVAWDDAEGGYWGSYRRNNDRYPEGARLPTGDGRDILGLPPGFKEINTTSDAIEMLAWFVERGAGGRCAARLEWMVDLVIGRLIDPYGALPYAYRRDWRPAAGLIRVGYQLTTARRLVLAPLSPDKGSAAVAKSCQLVDFCLEAAPHPEGGFCYAVAADGRSWPAAGRSSDLRQWWVQVEAIGALDALARHPSVEGVARARYRRACEEQWSFIRRQFFDDRNGGLLASPRDAAPRRQLDALRRWLLRQPPPPDRMKSHVWKDSLHEACTFLALASDRQEPVEP